jgi:hypothetical protein
MCTKHLASELKFRPPRSPTNFRLPLSVAFFEYLGGEPVLITLRAASFFRALDSGKRHTKASSNILEQTPRTNTGP